MENQPTNPYNGHTTILDFVLERMEFGDCKETIIQKLVQNGLEEEAAIQQFLQIEKVVLQAQKEQPTSKSFGLVLLGGLVTAIVGGIIWALIIMLTEYELSILAWGIGWTVAYAILYITGGKKGRGIQIIASLASFFGIIVGKYIFAIYLLKDFYRENFGELSASMISYFSLDSVQFFIDVFRDLVNPYDFLWFALAIGTAWKMTKGLEIKVPQTYQGSQTETTYM